MIKAICNKNKFCFYFLHLHKNKLTENQYTLLQYINLSILLVSSCAIKQIITF